MLPVFPIMALSGPLFTEMNDGEALLGGGIAFLVVFGGLWVGSVLAFALGKTLLQDYARRASRWATGGRVVRFRSGFLRASEGVFDGFWGVLEGFGGVFDGFQASRAGF